ncbi:hypothetical protein [Pararhizobium gei]|uniref:hypothetical protein n=1 Tax=Pararhizobium gei TaxID=1395951 RepID=UPI0023DC2E44|nr:hypothetical protein [Rhizobium gei]
MPDHFRLWKTRCANLDDCRKGNEKQKVALYKEGAQNREHCKNKRSNCKTKISVELTNVQKKTAAPIAVGNGGSLSSEQENFTPNSYPNTCADAINLAAHWLHEHRTEIKGPVIPALRDRFGLKNLDAIEATKRAHSLAYGGAV